MKVWSVVAFLAATAGSDAFASSSNPQEKIINLQRAQVAALKHIAASFDVVKPSNYTTNCEGIPENGFPVGFARVGKMVFLEVGVAGEILCGPSSVSRPTLIWFKEIPADLLPSATVRCFYGNNSPSGFGLLLINNKASGNSLEFYADAAGSLWGPEPKQIAIMNSSCSWVTL